MKRMMQWMVGLGVLCMAQMSRADYASEVMADGPEAYYRFEESAGATSVSDSSGNGHGSVAVSNVVFGAAGAIGNGGTFSNAYVQLNLQLDPAAGDFSIEALVCFDVTDVDRTMVFQKSGTGHGRGLLYRTSGGYLRTYLGGSGTTSSSAANQDEWHHVVMTVENGGATDTIRFYIDGQPAGSGTKTAEAANGDWILGYSSLIGALDEVAIYTNLLSAERIADHYTLVTPAASVAPLEWEQICENGFGNPVNNVSAFGAVEYEGTLYVGTHNITDGCEIWRFDGPSTSDWTKVSLNGFGKSENQIAYSMAVYQDKIYVGARNNGANGFEIWSYNGTAWTFVTNAVGLGDADLKIPSSMLVFDGKLILGTGNSWTDDKAKLYEFDGTNWVQINTASFGDSQNRQCRSLCEYDGKLYAGTYNNIDGGQVWRYDGPTPNDWTAVATNGFGIGNNQDTRSLCVYDGKLYAGTANDADGCQIWETSNGVDWVRNDPGTNLYFDATRVMVAQGANLFVGTGNALGEGGNATGAQVWRYTGETNWSQINENGFGFIDPEASKPTHMAAQFLLMKDGYLYAGASDSWNNGASVWRTWIGMLNLPPVASNDVALTQEDTSVAINVLANDTDDDGDLLTVSNVTQGAKDA